MSRSTNRIVPTSPLAAKDDHWLTAGIAVWLALMVLLLAGCNATPPEASAIKAVAEMCDKSGGKFKYFQWLTVIMECNR